MAKARAGVDVRVLGPGDKHDVPPILAAQRATYEHLLQAGVKIFEYQPAMMHAKTVIVDDDVEVHNTSDVLFRLCANTDPQRDSIFTKGPADVLDRRARPRHASNRSPLNYSPGPYDDAA